jgi:vacuolar-type H+-ATPase subunit H
MSSAYDSYMKRLLETERKAEERIRQAETNRDKTLEQAGELARAKIEQERKTMTAEFESKKVDNTKDREALMSRAGQDVQKDHELFDKNKGAVADMLVERVLNVMYELPKNVKKDYSSLRGTQGDSK